MGCVLYGLYELLGGVTACYDDGYGWNEWGYLV